MIAAAVVGVILLFIFLLLRALKRIGDPPAAAPTAVSKPQPAKAPPGFYRHPSGVIRWWDGGMWTEQTKPDQ
ncbi:DUF2510 domain-containing protein [Nocardia farcinica]|uniref:DUF2510 domain-containing protein n=1 Tax=Nocardia farcinica TaxID=37329 RepID=UPI00189385CA|nr:DUF2510 domain-containing protein [Nocardia farcinica]